MPRRPPHACRVIGSPWPGVFATVIDSAHTYGRHWHATYGFGFMERGAHRSLSGRGTVDAYAGEVITSNPGEVHDGRPLGSPSRRWRMIYLEPDVMATMVTPCAPPAIDVRLEKPVIRDTSLIPALRRLFFRLERWADDRTPLRALACEESLAEACHDVLRNHSTAAAEPAPSADVQRAFERLADDVVSAPSLSELAQLAGLSRYQVLRRFERLYGVTPYRWLRQARVERARAAIGQGKGLAQAAAECGFADQSHMTRAFVEHFGFTPGAWRAAALVPVQSRSRPRRRA